MELASENPFDSHRKARGCADVDFSNYDTPLFEQIVNRIKAKIAPRLRQGPLNHARYFMIPFAYQDEGASASYIEDL